MTETVYYAKLGGVDVPITQRIRELRTPQGQLFEKAVLVTNNGEMWREKVPKKGKPSSSRLGSITDLVCDSAVRYLAIPAYAGVENTIPFHDLLIVGEVVKSELVLYSQDIHLNALRTVLPQDVELKELV